MDGVQPTFFFQFALSINFILTAVALIMSIAAARKRNPAITEELYRDFATKKDFEQLRAQHTCLGEDIYKLLATKDDLAQVRAEHKSTTAEWFGALRVMASSTEDKFSALIRSVSLIEGEIRANRGGGPC